VVAGDRLLWAWSAAPLALLAMATVKNAHYGIAAQVPWSIWAALGLARWGGRLRRRGATPDRLRRRALGGFAALGLAYGLGFWLLGPWLDRRGVEWAFYESAARQVPAAAPLVLLYDDWDRNPYESPFGAFPHDLAVRLFYLRRPVSWHFNPVGNPESGMGNPESGIRNLEPGIRNLESGIGNESSQRHAPIRTPGTGSSMGGSKGPGRIPAPGSRLPNPLYVIGRDRDRPALERLGPVAVLARGPSARWDRTFTLFRVATEPSTPGSPAPVARTGSPAVQR
jgi:hypothetical protein